MKDFHEIVTEAGRYKYIIRKGRDKDLEDLPERESMRDPIRGKSESVRARFLDRLPPIKRWLWKQVNRPWNKVWSEISELDFRGMAGNHIRDHINDWVERYPIYDGKIPCRVSWQRILLPLDPKA